MKLKLFGTILLCSICFTLPAQKYLKLVHSFYHKQITFKPGERIRFQLKEESFFRTDQFIDVQDTSIVFSGIGSVYPGQVNVIDISNKSGLLLKMLQKFVLIGGPTFVLLDMINSGKIDPGFILIAGSITVSLFTLLKVTQRKRFRHRGKNKIVPINLSANE